MIRILPVPQEKLPEFCRERSLEVVTLRAYTAEEGDNSLGWCAVGEGDPCPILGVAAKDPEVADGLLRAALFPLYGRGYREYRFAAPPALTLPERYVTAGAGSLEALFAPCTEGRQKNE